jgi:hypothetical protein
VPNYKVIILESAISEIADSCSYYNEKVSGLGYEFEEEIFQMIEIIKENPFLFPVKFSDIHEAVLLSFPFVVNYEVRGKQINILVVFHTKRHPDNKLKRKRK